MRNAILSGADVKVDACANALRDLARCRREIAKVLVDVGLLVLPTVADPPFKVEVGLTHKVSARNTLPFDLYGIPTRSIPCSFASAGLPVGLQTVGAPWAKSTVLALAHAYEQSRDRHNRHPKLG